MITKLTTTRCWIGSAKVLGLAALAALVLAAAPANAAVTYSGSALGNNAGQTNSATATFALTISGTTTDLVVTLSNTATYKPNDSPDILEAVFFTLAGNPALTRISGVLNTNSVGVENGSNLSIPSGHIGGSWAYSNSLSGAPGGANEGLSASGLSGMFGSGEVFPDAIMPGDSSPPNGVGGGLTTSVDDGSQYNGGLSGKPLIKDSAVFTLGNVPASLTLAQISTVSFGYGTLPDQTFPATLVPEPSSVSLALAGIALLGLLGRRRR